MARQMARGLIAIGVLLFGTPVLGDPEALRTSTFHVEGMTCGLCEKAIEKSLRALAGVRRIEVDRESKRVSVVAEPAIATDRLEAAIESAGGFEAQWIQTE